MIKITIDSLNDNVNHIHVSGHGGLDYGKDVICAGVSSVVIGALNALKENENFKISISEGNVEITIINDISMHDKVVLETLIVQLYTISNSYPDRVQIKEFSRKEGTKWN